MTALTIHSVTDGDSSLLHSLAQLCAPLDVHTPYTYWVLAHMFGKSCFIVREGDDAVGFVTSVHEGDRALLWQVGVLEAHRGRGVSRMLIGAVVDAARDLGLSSVELSIDPANASSLGAFRGYAARHDLTFEAIGEVDLEDLHDAAFTEFEHLYALRLVRS